MTSGTKIRLLREHKNWDQNYLSSLMEISQPALSKIESDQTKLSWNHAIKLADIFEVSPEFFFESSIFNNNTNSGNGNQVINPQSYYENNLQLIKSIYEDHLHTKNELLESRNERILELKKQIEDLKSELATFKKSNI